MMKQLSSTILKGKNLQKIIMTSTISSKKSITQISNHLKQIASNNGLVSLSANQLASEKSIFVMVQKPLIKTNKFYNYNHKSHQYETFINPKILDFSVSEVKGWQQCPSYPNLKFFVKRSTHIIVEYEKSFKDRVPLHQQWKGFGAIIIQHECDHLNCINLFDISQDIDLAQNDLFSENKRKKLKQEFQKFQREREQVKSQRNKEGKEDDNLGITRWGYKNCLSLKNFVEYEILDPV